MSNADAASFGRAFELLRGLNVPIELAAAHYSEAFKILGGDRIVEAAKDFIRRNPAKREPRTVRQVADELIALKIKRNASDRYIEDLNLRLAKVATVFASDIANITTGEIQTWLDGMKASPRSVKNFRDTANSLFKFAEARGYIARGENPVNRTEKVETRNNEVITIYTPTELHRLIEAAPVSFKPIIALQAFAGLRSAEIMRLDFADIKLERGHIELGAHKTKTATRRLVPITANLAQWLAPHALKSGKVFRHSRAYFHEMQRNISAATANDGKKIVEWKHNALRHSFVSYRVADTGDVPRVALESGNSPAMIFENYREVVDTKAAKAWFAIAPEQTENTVSIHAAGK